MTANPEDEAYLAELASLVDRTVRSTLRWYRDHKATPRRVHRAGLTVVILLGALIPAVAASGIARATLVTSLLGVAVSTITGLGAAFRWESRWSAFSAAQVDLEAQLARWELEMLRARAAGPDGRTIAHEATARLLEGAGTTIRQEAQDFFQAAPAGTDHPER